MKNTKFKLSRNINGNPVIVNKNDPDMSNVFLPYLSTSTPAAGVLNIELKLWEPIINHISLYETPI